MLRKLKWQIPEEPLAARYNWCQVPVPGRGLAVEKHWYRVFDLKQSPIVETLVFRMIRRWQAILQDLDRPSPVPCFPSWSRVQVSVVTPAVPMLLPISFLSTPMQIPDYYINVCPRRLLFTWFTSRHSLSLSVPFSESRPRKQLNCLLVNTAVWLPLSDHYCSTFRLVIEYQSKDGRRQALG